MSNGVATEKVTDSVAKVDGEIAVGEDLVFQRKWWRFENTIWIVFACLLALDLAGAFGRGPLAHAQKAAPDGSMQIRYERIERTSTPAILSINFPAASIHDGQVRLFVSESMQRQLGAQRVIPSPQAATIGQGGLLYSFPASTPPASVEFALEPDGPGIRHLTLQVEGAAPVSLTIFVMP